MESHLEVEAATTKVADAQVRLKQSEASRLALAAENSALKLTLTGVQVQLRDALQQRQEAEVLFTRDRKLGQQASAHDMQTLRDELERERALRKSEGEALARAEEQLKGKPCVRATRMKVWHPYA